MWVGPGQSMKLLIDENWWQSMTIDNNQAIDIDNQWTVNAKVSETFYSHWLSIIIEDQLKSIN